MSWELDGRVLLHHLRHSDILLPVGSPGVVLVLSRLGQVVRVLLQVLEGFLEPDIVGERDVDGQSL